MAGRKRRPTSSVNNVRIPDKGQAWRSSKHNVQTPSPNPADASHSSESIENPVEFFRRIKFAFLTALITWPIALITIFIGGGLFYSFSDVVLKPMFTGDIRVVQDHGPYFSASWRLAYDYYGAWIVSGVVFFLLAKLGR